MIKFGFVGFLCFFIDYGIMVLLTEVAGIVYLVSSACSFTVSVIVNYILSVTFVFETDKEKSRSHTWNVKENVNKNNKKKKKKNAVSTTYGYI